MERIDQYERDYERAVGDADAAADIQYGEGDACPYCGPEHRLHVEPGQNETQNEPSIPASLFCENCGDAFAWNIWTRFETVPFLDLKAGDVVEITSIEGWPSHVTLMAAPEPFPSALFKVTSDQPEAIINTNFGTGFVRVRRHAPQVTEMAGAVVSKGLRMYKAAFILAGTIARMTLPGEPTGGDGDGKGEMYEQTADDAVATLEWLIKEARSIIEGGTNESGA